MIRADKAKQRMPLPALHQSLNLFAQGQFTQMAKETGAASCSPLMNGVGA